MLFVDPAKRRELAALDVDLQEIDGVVTRVVICAYGRESLFLVARGVLDAQPVGSYHVRHGHERTLARYLPAEQVRGHEGDGERKRETRDGARDADEAA